VDRRHANQQKRIGEGLENGSLTTGEAKHLETRQQKLNKEEAGMRRADGGKLTAADKTKLRARKIDSLKTSRHRNTMPSISRSAAGRLTSASAPNRNVSAKDWRTVQ